MPDPTDPVRPPDVELAAEQEHLAGSRHQLARMRERTEAMDAAAAADWVSREYLESTFALRMRQLADDPTIPLFFGRLDYGDGERFHIGRRHISDPTGEPMDVRRRRRYGFQSGRLTAYEDEDLAAPAGAGHSAILEAEIERPRVGPMRDIVATIQPEQDVIVRADLSRSVCVQGAPGTGKTAVGLHRAAYLLYAHREQLTRQGVLVVGPNASFLRYIRDVLPALGEIDATQSTIGELVDRTLSGLNPRWGVHGADDAAVATLKGDPRLAEVLRRALWSHVTAPARSPARGPGPACCARRRPAPGRRATPRPAPSRPAPGGRATGAASPGRRRTARRGGAATRRPPRRRTTRRASAATRAAPAARRPTR